MNKALFEKYLGFLVNAKTWQEAGIVAAIVAGLFIMLNSFLFDFALAILKLLLLVLLIALIGRTAYLAYPILKKKYEESQKKEP